MKKLLNYLLIIALCIISISTNAQDLITKKDGTDISAKVLEITILEVKYKKFDNLSGPIFTMLKSDVLMIKYENGTNDVFNETVSADNVSSSTDDMCEKAKEDANMYYPVKNTGAAWSMATTIAISPLFGIIPTLICSNAEPKDINLHYPDRDLMKNYDYNRCYKEEALKMKKQKIFKLAGIGSGIWLLALAYNLTMAL